MTADEFISLCTCTANDTTDNRRDLVRIFKHVHENLECVHEVADAYYLAHYILSYQHAPGPLVEFGCYKGGMSCKLSHVAQLVGKEYIIFDSFAGIPTAADYTQTAVIPSVTYNFCPGAFSASQAALISNISLFGVLPVCVLVAGIIEQTLSEQAATLRPAFVFIDVDVAETALHILRELWDNLTTDCFFTHETCIAKYVHALQHDDWWLNNLKRPAPAMGRTLFSATTGLPNSACLDFLIKNETQLAANFKLSGM